MFIDIIGDIKIEEFLTIFFAVIFLNIYILNVSTRRSITGKKSFVGNEEPQEEMELVDEADSESMQIYEEAPRPRRFFT